SSFFKSATARSVGWLRRRAPSVMWRPRAYRTRAIRALRHFSGGVVTHVHAAGTGLDQALRAAERHRVELHGARAGDVDAVRVVAEDRVAQHLAVRTDRDPSHRDTRDVHHVVADGAVVARVDAAISNAVDHGVAVDQRVAASGDDILARPAGA